MTESPNLRYACRRCAKQFFESEMASASRLTMSGYCRPCGLAVGLVFKTPSVIQDIT